jgi:hypothetical protein
MALFCHISTKLHRRSGVLAQGELPATTFCFEPPTEVGKGYCGADGKE